MEREQIYKQIYSENDHQTWEQISHKVDNQIRYKFYAQIFYEIWDQTRHRINNIIVDQIFSDLRKL